MKTMSHQLLYSSVKEYKESKDTKYKFKKFAFVSASGFVDNALELAIDNHIDCYIKENEKFKKIDKWN